MKTAKEIVTLLKSEIKQCKRQVKLEAKGKFWTCAADCEAQLATYEFLLDFITREEYPY